MRPHNNPLFEARLGPGPLDGACALLPLSTHHEIASSSLSKRSSPKSSHLDPSPTFRWGGKPATTWPCPERGPRPVLLPCWAGCSRYCLVVKRLSGSGGSIGCSEAVGCLTAKSGCAVVPILPKD